MDRYQFMDGVFVYYVTFTITDWLPIFVTPEPIQIIVDSLEYSIKEKGLRINAYVIMPNHMHMIVFDAHFENSRLQLSLSDFRKYTGNQLANYIDNHLSPAIAAVIRSKDLDDRERQVWQPGWHAEGLATEKFWKQKMGYIHMNPVRKGLVWEPEHWRYSSANYWVNDGKSDLPISSIQVENE
jgi:REP element-mobilizing transposase RayT